MIPINYTIAGLDIENVSHFTSTSTGFSRIPFWPKIDILTSVFPVNLVNLCCIVLKYSFTNSSLFSFHENYEFEHCCTCLCPTIGKCLSLLHFSLLSFSPLFLDQSQGESAWSDPIYGSM